jgi:hypothetical protein
VQYENLPKAHAKKRAMPLQKATHVRFNGPTRSKGIHPVRKYAKISTILQLQTNQTAVEAWKCHLARWCLA